MIGTDIIDKRRIEKQLEKHGDRFIRFVLHANEIKDFEKSAFPIKFLASRWASKEAFSKALGTGIRKPVLMNQIEIKKNHLGAPYFIYSDEIKALLGERSVYLTISDEKNYCVAFVLIQ